MALRKGIGERQRVINGLQHREQERMAAVPQQLPTGYGTDGRRSTGDCPVCQHVGQDCKCSPRKYWQWHLARYATHVVMLCALVAQANRSERAGQTKTAASIKEEVRKLATLWGMKAADVDGLAREVEALEVEAATR